MYLSKLPNVFVCLNNQTVSSCKLSHCMCRPQIAVSSPLPDISIWPPKTHPPHSRQLAECIYLKKMSTCIGLIIAKCICLPSFACLPPWHLHMTPKTPPSLKTPHGIVWGCIQIPTSKITLPVELLHLQLMKIAFTFFLNYNTTQTQKCKNDINTMIL